MRRASIVALAVVVLGALWLSGSATLALGERHGVPVLALPALVVVLEVAAVIGTALWITAEDGRARRKPAAVVLLASAVAAVGGWQAYGWLGLVAPVSTVLVTDMLAERWAGLGRPELVEVGEQGADAVRPPSPPEEPLVSAPPVDELDPDDDGEEPPSAQGGEQGASDAEIRGRIAAHIAAHGRPPGRDAVKAEHGIGSRRAERLLADVPVRPVLAAVGEEGR